MVQLMGNALIIAGSGLLTAERAFTRAASETVHAAEPVPVESYALPSSTAPAAVHTPPLDMATGIVAQMQPEARFKINLALHRTANDLYRALLKATAS